MAASPRNDAHDFPQFPIAPPPPTQPRVLPPPPQQPHPIAPPPPHVMPPPPSPSNATIVVIVVFSFGGLFLLGAFLLALYCLVNEKRKKKKEVEETEDIDVDEHMKVRGLIMPGPHGPRTVVLSVEDDVNVHERFRKNEIEGLHAVLPEGGGGASASGSAVESQTLSDVLHLLSMFCSGSMYSAAVMHGFGGAGMRSLLEAVAGWDSGYILRYLLDATEHVCFCKTALGRRMSSVRITSSWSMLLACRSSSAVYVSDFGTVEF
ncbi:hypothetical protein Nepgr_002674 [Nepenthes gracilis]|uniref:Uncharacterized protein n=1 Tax=Nepenthes gracilis TaxID=150966 RepID=A0AAD3P878_NEPGR|nr:hypothetical protein Nepgr_002674 [Nepenthes gracilis]